MQLQPKRTPIRRSSTNVDSPSFSPIRLEDPRPPTGVNLTGVPRRVRDRCADVYNLLGKWQKLKLRGARVIKEIALQGNRLDEPPQHQGNLFESCDNLLGIVENLEKVVNSLRDVHENFVALVEIDALASRSSLAGGEGVGIPKHVSTCSDRAPFIGLTLEEYSMMVRDIEAAYRRELIFKKSLIRKIPIQTSAGVLTFASICWMNDAHIDERISVLVLALVAECGFE